MVPRSFITAALAVLALGGCTLPSSASASTTSSVVWQPGCGYGYGHEQCFDGNTCYLSGRLGLQLTPDAFALIRQDATPDDTGIPELDSVNISLGVTRFTHLGSWPHPGDDPSEPYFRWFYARFPGSVPEAIAAYLSSARDR